MRSDTAFAWYRLFRTEGFGPRAMHLIWKTVKQSGTSLEDVFDMDESEFEKTFPELGRGRLRRAEFEAIRAQDVEALYEEYRRLKENEIEIIHPGHELHSERFLALIEQGICSILFCGGLLSLLGREGIAIVGSRNASEKGMAIAKDFAEMLALEGENVVSGYAKGIDTAAHLGALQKDGTTTIVLSHGILHFSRKRTPEELNWEKNTLVVSQFHPTAGWNPANAMIRNKLVCALSRALIVVESGSEVGEDGKMSGTFDAGKTALEMGVPLFVVSPKAFKKPPSGNKALLNRGGIEMRPEEGIRQVLEHLKTRSAEQKETLATGDQLMLF